MLGRGSDVSNTTTWTRLCLFDKGKDKKWDGKCGKCYIGVDLAAGLLLCSVCMFPTQKEENRKLASMNMFLCKSIEILHF